MPSLTVKGKRQIIKDAIDVLGRQKVIEWTDSKNIDTLRHFNEHVRKYGAKYFRELFELTQEAK